MLDHFGMGVEDYAAARRFYERVLATLGMEIIMDVPRQPGASGGAACGFGRDGNPAFWLSEGTAATGLHIAFTASDRAEVDAFFAVALEAGGRDNGKPGIRAQYHPNYYAAFVYDLDGNNIEAVCHGPGEAADQKSP